MDIKELIDDLDLFSSTFDKIQLISLFEDRGYRLAQNFDTHDGEFGVQIHNYLVTFKYDWEVDMISVHQDYTIE